MVRLSTAHLEIAKRAAADLFRYNRTAEAHAAILRTDPNRYAQVYEAYAASAPPLGFMPPPAAIDEEIKQGEQLLSNKVGCTEFIDHLAVLSTCVYLTRLIKTKLASISENVLLAAMREHTQLERQSPLVPGPEPIWLANPHPLLLGEQLPPASPSSSQAQDNSNEELQNKATVQVTPHLLNAWKRNPGVLQQKIFIITPEEGDLPSTAFRLHALLTIGKTRVFYLVFEGEGNEAVLYQDDVFFEMVGSAKKWVGAWLYVLLGIKNQPSGEIHEQNVGASHRIQCRRTSDLSIRIDGLASTKEGESLTNLLWFEFM